MKKFIQASLLLVFFSRAGDDADTRWNAAVKPVRSLFSPHKIEMLNLTKAGITELPENPHLPDLERLYLNKNEIRYINPEMFELFLTKLPKLRTLDLSGNPLTKKNVSNIRGMAAEVADKNKRVIEVIW